MTEILVLSSGVQTTVQDLGRFGYQSLGVPPSGAMDRDALETANLLVGNPRGEACLECVLGGLELECGAPLVFAVCGVPMDPRVNGKPAPGYETLRAKAGDVISLGMAERGLCAYIAFAGGLAVDPVLKSRSTYARAGFGGWRGRPLRAGDRIPLREGAAGPSAAPGLRDASPLIRFVPEELRPRYSAEITLRAIRSHEAARFQPESLSRFFSEPFFVSPKSDRMGCRLEGPSLAHSRGADILSAGVQTGTVQVPGDGFPIILRVDRQTTGGYARIAHVIQTDFAKLGQLRPGDSVRFLETTVEAAQEAWKKREAAIVKSIREKTDLPRPMPRAESGIASRAAPGAQVSQEEMRHFNVIVNGIAYDVTLREIRV
ncbi:MAG TPA: biotin-dependent carboxyltransferase family protein [Rectinemataceae bacterium]|nr:biotin-dependent carboxyltransferase family protein [Rectinemataceae bacterium]